MLTAPQSYTRPKPLPFSDYLRVSDLIQMLEAFQQAHGDVKVGVGSKGVDRLVYGRVGLTDGDIKGCVIEVS